MAEVAKTPGGAGRMLLIGAAAIALLSIAYGVTHNSEAPPVAPSPALPSASTAATQDPAALIQDLQNRVGANPNDAEGWQTLGWAYFEASRYADSARAYKRATALVPGNATFWSSLGEALVMGSKTDPMPADAASAFEKAIAIDAKEPRARYFLAVRRDLKGDHKGAIDDWLALLKDTPSGAPWEQDLRRTIEQVGRIHKVDVAGRLGAIKPAAPHPALPSVATAAIPGPTREQMQAAAALPKGQQDQMVEGMVSSLVGKLKANPANVDGWIMLIRSRMTLGQAAQASAAVKNAIAANPPQAARIRDEAKLLDVPGL
ncbi:MAG: tetratricopeptide repeat protein [Sphingobium sp.]|uniref:tetratricopeptide repeat protein n=1 Tax=Sphingobium sp. TaxID=1912891 RepID=UPI0029B869A4|nr:tetratricopeptide repeat protein [Sphingobium sp.]MDX3909032.1 tetratricopeptide repeat protein [Sphingobium sp.]